MTTISVDKKDNTVFLKIDHDGKEVTHSLEVFLQHDNVDNVVFSWLMKNCKDIFYQLPIELEIKCQEHCAEFFNVPLGNLATVFEKTGNAIKGLTELNGIGKDYQSILFWNVADDARYKGLCSQLSQKADVKYMNFVPGFDRKLRKWVGADIPMTVNEFVEYVTANQIGKIVTINYYVVDKYVEKTGISLIAICNYLGIEWIILDNDPPDLRATGFLHKAWHHNGDMAFSNLSVLNDFWDKKYGIDTTYTAIPQDYTQKEPYELDDDYTIVVLTNSRLEAVKEYMPQIQFLLQRMPYETMFTDIHTWYLATRHRLLYEMDLDEYQQLFHNSMLHRFYYHVVNYLKFYIVSHLKTDRLIEVYGDVGWGQLFPQYYKGVLYNDEIEKLYSEKNHLFLLVNCSMTYLDASGPVYDVIARNVPWCNVPVMARTSRFNGLKALEYSNYKELNHLVNNYKLIRSPSLEMSLEYYRKVLHDSTNEIVGKISGTNQYVGKLFHEELDEHKRAVDRTVQSYMDKNKELLDITTKTFFNM